MSIPTCSEERIGLTQEDHLIFRARTTVAEQARLLTADRRDFAAMAACTCDRDSADLNVELNDIPDAVAVRIHHGVMAFREVAL